MFDARQAPVRYRHCTARRCVFTSGYTGRAGPLPQDLGPAHRMRARRGQPAGCPAAALLRHRRQGSAQHMYAVVSRACCWRGVMRHGPVSRTSVLPRRTRRAGRGARPRILISTPIPMRELLESGMALPPGTTDRIVHRSPGAAARAESSSVQHRRVGIYGSTETGRSRCASDAPPRVAGCGPAVNAVSAGRGGPGPRRSHRADDALCDVLEVTRSGAILLHGSVAALVNIAGKRSSLAYLNNQLHSIPGVSTALIPPRIACLARRRRSRAAWRGRPGSGDGAGGAGAAPAADRSVFLPRKPPPPAPVQAQSKPQSDPPPPTCCSWRAAAQTARASSAGGHEVHGGGALNRRETLRGRRPITIAAEHPRRRPLPGAPILPGVLGSMTMMCGWRRSAGARRGTRWRIGGRSREAGGTGETLNSSSNQSLPNGRSASHLECRTTRAQVLVARDGARQPHDDGRAG